MRILFNAMKYEYGEKTRGISFEYDLFYSVFKSMGFNIDHYDYLEAYSSSGSQKVNTDLIDILKTNRYDLIFTFLYTDQFNEQSLKLMRENDAPSIAFMADDKWRWDSFGSKVCWGFDYVITTDPDAVAKYENIGYHGAILSQWACNPNIHKKLNINKDIDVSFVGLVSPWRKWVIKQITNAGINIQCFGAGWPGGRVDLQEMVEVFNRSRITLNISNSVQMNLRYIFSSFEAFRDFRDSPKRKEDIKARFFEALGCGVFLLSYNVEHLNDYLIPGKDLVCYSSVKDMIDKIRYYLENDNEREVIASSGYEHVVREHTYNQRFEKILKIIDLT